MLIAGNAPARRVARLRELKETVDGEFTTVEDVAEAVLNDSK